MPPRKPLMKNVESDEVVPQVAKKKVVDRDRPMKQVATKVVSENNSGNFADSTGMITAGGVEVIGLLGLVTLIYATLCLFLIS